MNPMIRRHSFRATSYGLPALLICLACTSPVTEENSGKSIFVVVGSGHVVGDRALLAGRGFHVETARGAGLQ